MMTGTIDLQPFATILGDRGMSTEAQDIAPWLTDWRGRFTGAARAILAPASTAEVAEVVRLAAAKGVPLVPQGGNTSMVGGATPPPDGSALILSLRRMNRIRDVRAQEHIAICDAGVILSDLHMAAEAAGCRFPLTLGAKGSATIGGLVSTNAGGTQVLRHGTMRTLVAGLEAVMPDGCIYDALSPLKKNSTGPDLKQLLIGGEGCFGVVTGATLRLVPAITDRAVGWVALPSPQDALALLRFLEERLDDSVEGFELMADDTMDAVLAHIPGTRLPVEQRAPWHVLIEVDFDSPRAQTAAACLEQALASYFAQADVADAVIAQNEAQAEAFWRIRDSISAAERASGPALQFDISVPVAAMPGFIGDMTRRCEQRYAGATASCFGHLGDGNVHFHVRSPVNAPDRAAWVSEHAGDVAAFVHDAVLVAGGSISAEHGIGQMKRAEFGRSAPAAQIRLLSGLKAAIDPHNLFNPGKLIPLASEWRGY